jgi:hypothetical protein
MTDFNAEAVVAAFLREYPNLVLTREQQDRLAEMFEKEWRDCNGDIGDYA